MPVFEYQAITSSGKQVKGTSEAESLRAARQKLRLQGLYPTDLREVGEITTHQSRDVRRYFQTDRVSLKDLAVMTRQLSTLVGAGLPLVSAFNALSEQTESAVLKRIVVAVREQVEEGISLAKALGQYPKIFPRLFVNMVTAGEASGTLDKAFENLADYLESQVELRRRVVSALIYPILMLFLCGGVLIALLVFVVPQIVDMFRQNGRPLPLPTQIVLTMSDLVTGFWPFLLLLAIATPLSLRFYYRQPKGRALCDRLLIRLPIYGKISVKIITARVARTLGTLLSNGVGLLDALEIVKNIIGNVHFQKALENAREGVREGKSLAKELGKSQLFPVMLGHMIAVGERSGELEGMLCKAGKAYENEVNATVAGLTSLLEPLLIVVVGAIVAGIVISMLLPLADMSSLMQR